VCTLLHGCAPEDTGASLGEVMHQWRMTSTCASLGHDWPQKLVLFPPDFQPCSDSLTNTTWKFTDTYLSSAHTWSIFYKGWAPPFRSPPSSERITKVLQACVQYLSFGRLCHHHLAKSLKAPHEKLERFWWSFIDPTKHTLVSAAQQSCVRILVNTRLWVHIANKDSVSLRDAKNKVLLATRGAKIWKGSFMRGSHGEMG
jgi:hypothetical protein